MSGTRNQVANITVPLTASEASVVSAETVTIPAGAAGTIKDFYFNRKPILGLKRNWIGGYTDTSITLTSSCFTNEVSPETLDANLANGDYWVDYVTGRGRGKKADTATSMTATYYVFAPVGRVTQVIEEAVTVSGNSGTLAHVPLLVQSVYLSVGTVTGIGQILPSSVAPTATKQVKITMTTGVLDFLAADAVTQAKVTYIY